jgi:uncharacterized protein (TIGR03086 family)
MSGEDPRPLFNRATAQATQVVTAVRPDQLHSPTPCKDWDVRALLAHMVSGLGRVSAMAVQRAPAGGSSGADDRWAEAYRDAAAAAQNALRNDAVLEETYQAPFGSMPGRDLLRVFTVEVATHTWDLAHAIGSTSPLDPEIGEVAFAMASRWVPAEPRGDAIPFGAVVPVPADADVYNRLAGWLGRRP